MNQENFVFILVQIIYWIFIMFSLYQLVIMWWLRENSTKIPESNGYNYENITMVNNFIIKLPLSLDLYPKLYIFP